jgi:DNA polymerase-3 subunit gamma/tau
MSEGQYQVIARRWRPQQFDEIVGQEHIVRTLKNAILNNRIGHAYLFVGPRGTGKTTTARIFAKALNCVNGPSIAPAVDDPICKSIVAGSCMDVIEIDAASNRGIDDAKQIRDECQYAPAECKFKIYIIDEVHQLTKDAFNTLLKILEEPPPHVKFIFATTESDKVMATITSRCQRFEFQPIPEVQIADRLTTIVNADGVNADRPALMAIARLANGGMRDSQSILDQVISFCGKNITEKDVLDIYGLAAVADIEGLCKALACGDHAGVIAYADKFVTEGRDLVRVLRHAQDRTREALLAAIRSKGETDTLGAPLATEQLLRMLETLQAGEPGLRGGLSERAHFEVTLLKALEQSRSRAIDTLIRDLASLSADTPQGAGLKKISRPRLASELYVSGSVKVDRPEVKASRIEVRAEITAPAKPVVAPARIPAPVAKAAPTKAPAPTQAPQDSFSDGPPLEDLETGVDFTDATPPEFRDSPREAPVAREVTAGPGDADFETAVSELPEPIRTRLERDFRAKFTELGRVDEVRLILAGGKTGRAPKVIALEDEISPDAPPVSE